MNPQQPMNNNVPPAAPAPQAPESAPVPPAQPPIMNAVGTTPKKSKKGLIIGIIAGSVVLIGIIAAVLVYFLVMRSPQRVLEEAVVNAIVADNAITEGKMTVELDGGKMTAEFKGSYLNGDQSLELVLGGEGPDGVKVTLPAIEVRTFKDAVYVKANNVKDAVVKSLDAFLEEQMADEDYTDAQIQAYKDLTMQPFENIIKKIDGQWIKIKYSDMAETKESKCTTEVLQKIHGNREFQQEIAKIYRENRFLMIKEDLGDKDGLRGFSIDLDSTESRDARKGFITALKETSIVKELNSCVGSSDDEDEDFFDNSSNEASYEKTELKVWVDMGASQLRRIEIVGSDSKSSSKLKGTTIEFSLEPGKANPISEPTDAVNFTDLMSDLYESFGGMPLAGFGSSSRA